MLRITRNGLSPGNDLAALRAARRLLSLRECLAGLRTAGRLLSLRECLAGLRAAGHPDDPSNERRHAFVLPRRDGFLTRRSAQESTEVDAQPDGVAAGRSRRAPEWITEAAVAASVTSTVARPAPSSTCKAATLSGPPATTTRDRMAAI